MLWFKFFAVSFLIRILSGGSFISRIRRKYGQRLASFIHRVDKLTHRCVKLNNDISFLNKCIQLRVAPKFVRFKTANSRLRQSAAYGKSQNLLLKDELRSKHRDRGRISVQLERLKSDIFVELNSLDACCFRLWLSISARRYNESVKTIQNKKLAKLSPEFSIVPLKPDEVILNLSSYSLSEAEKNALVYGLNYTLCTSDFSDLEFTASVELAARKLKSNISDNDSWTQAKRLLTSSIPSRFSSKCNRNDKRMSDILSKLGKNDNLYISKPDKGNGIVILNRSDYVAKMENVLSDSSKFVSVNENCYKLTQRLESRLNKALLTLFKANKIDKATYDRIRAVGSSPGKLYGLPKTHKTGVPVRPILSAVTCHNYKLAKFLVPLLSPLASSDFTVTDVFSFAKEIQERTDLNRQFMISLDIESLFTNVPVSETIDIILSKLFPHNSVIYNGFTRNEFSALLKLAVEDSYFVFDGKMYKQIDGMAMGSPLGPLFANIFLSHYESQWLNDSPVKPILYRRYVDDTLWLLPAGSDLSRLMSHMNSRHANMRFTFETEANDCIHFIGLTITHNTSSNNVHSYVTSVYRKPTSTSLFMNFNSFTPLAYRLSVFKCLVYRALRLCSTWSLFHDEVTSVKSMLLRNAFPAWILDRIIKSSVSKFINPSVVMYGPSKERVYIGLPFAGKSTDSVRRAIQQICKKFVPHKDVIVFFKPGRQVSNFFRIKDATPHEMRSNVVYQYTCAECHSSYIGQTTRHLRHRVAEHAGLSHLTGNTVKSKVHSSIRDHCLQCQNATCLLRDFKILAKGSTDLELLVKERLLIDQTKPGLNCNIGALELLLA